MAPSSPARAPTNPSVGYMLKSTVRPSSIEVKYIPLNVHDPLMSK